jgi:putative ABC transport system permease protein
VAIGVYLTFRIIDFPDLTVDASFPLGAAVTGVCLLNGMNPYLATLVSLFAGAFAGFITAYLHVRWNILGLLASILTMTGLYSINLRIMKTPSLVIMDEPTLFQHGHTLSILLLIVVLTLTLLHFFFASHFGLGLRAAGINPRAGAAYGISVKFVKLTVLAMSNALVALAGALFVQSQGFADISMGTGTVVVGLASVIMGESLFRTPSLIKNLIACVFGSLAYRFAISLALNTGELGLESSDLNLITACLVAAAMIFAKMRSRT